MISKDEFRKSPKFTMLKAKVKAVLDTDPDYIKAASKLEAAARDMYKELENRAMEDALDAENEDRIANALDDYTEAEELKDEVDEAMAKAQAKEVEAKLTMRSIEKKIIHNLISDPDDAETVYHYYYD